MGRRHYEKALYHFDLHQHAELLKDDSCCPELVEALEYWLEFSIDNPIAHKDHSWGIILLILTMDFPTT